MNAIELAADLESVGVYTDAVAMLRRQHEAIVKLREALEMIDDSCMGGSRIEMLCRNALKDTEEFK